MSQALLDAAAGSLNAEPPPEVQRAVAMQAATAAQTLADARAAQTATGDSGKLMVFLHEAQNDEIARLKALGAASSAVSRPRPMIAAEADCVAAEPCIFVAVEKGLGLRPALRGRAWLFCAIRDC